MSRWPSYRVCPPAAIMFREMMPNLMPYLAASFIGNTAGSILAAIGLEILGLGPQRLPTSGAHHSDRD